MKTLEHWTSTFNKSNQDVSPRCLCWLYRPLWLKHPALKFATSDAQNVFIHVR